MDQQITNVVAWFERIYLGGVPQLIRDETAFLSFVCMLAGIEALGGYRDPDASGPTANRQRFQAFVTDYFPIPYRPHASNLWDFRNGMVHGFSPRQFALTHHNSSIHFRLTADGAIILDRNRVNVAISRAQCLAVVVADPRIASAIPGSLDEMMILNLLCKLADASAST
jgi:hypothetical protein